MPWAIRMLILGVDVGVRGAIACLSASDGSFVDLEDLPIMRHRTASWIDATELAAIIRNWRGPDRVPARAIVERIHGMPKMTSVANNSKGMTLGSTLAVLQITGCAIELVEPGVWKRALGLLMPHGSDSEKKRASLQKARAQFPSAPLEAAGHHNRAEACLIAHWYLQKSAQHRLEVA